MDVYPWARARTFQQGQPATGVRPLAAVSSCAGRLLRRFWNVGIGHEQPSPTLSHQGGSSRDVIFPRTRQPYTSKYIQPPSKETESKLAREATLPDFRVSPSAAAAAGAEPLRGSVLSSPDSGLLLRKRCLRKTLHRVLASASPPPPLRDLFLLSGMKKKA